MTATDAHTVVELRRYTTVPGRRDALIDLFDREFVEPQEAAGMRIIGQFRDTGNPDLFVWIRSFPDMAARERALRAFYGGPVWKRHRDAANATMLDSDNVLLLRPARPGSGFAASARPRPPVGARAMPAPAVTVTVCHLPGPAEEAFVRFVVDEVLPLAQAAPARPAALLETEAATNTFPALPVREGEHVLAWVSVYDSPRDHRDHLRRLSTDPDWTGRILPALRAGLVSPPEDLLLAPTARSELR